MKKAILFALWATVHYFAAVLVLYILVTLFNDSFENIWLSAMTVTIISGLLELIFYLWKKRKK